MNEVMDKLCPVKTITSKHKPVPWVSRAIEEHMYKRKFFYDWWKLKRKDESGDMLYSTYRRLDNETKYLIRSSIRGKFIDSYNEAKTSQEKWNMIHL